jgi:hypothetical protein
MEQAPRTTLIPGPNFGVHFTGEAPAASGQALSRTSAADSVDAGADSGSSVTAGIPCAARGAAVIANTGNIIVNAQGRIDAYDSSRGTYGGANVNSNGVVQAATNILVNGGVIDAIQLPSFAAKLPAAQVPSGAIPLPLGRRSPGSLNINTTGDSITLSPGTYVATNINVNFPGAITISPPGQVHIYVTGSLNLGGNENVGGVPENLEFFVTSPGWVNVNSGGSLVGRLYAPTSSVNVNSTVFGSISGSSVTVNSGGAVHYDQAEACPPAVTCSNVQQSAGNAASLSLSQNLGSEIVQFTQTTSAPLQGSPATVNTTITLGGQLIETQTVIGLDASGVVRLTTTFGPLVQGIHEIDATANSAEVDLTVDGRAVQPIPAAQFQNAGNAPTLVFTDGQPAPIVHVTESVLQAVTAITAAAQTASASSSCSLPDPGDAPAGNGGPFDQPGHTSDGQKLPSCINCQADCTNTRAACLYAGSIVCGSTAAAFVPVNPFLALGIAIGCEGTKDWLCLNQAKNCYDSCNGSAACCPVACGPSCCNMGENCLDSALGLCCGVGYKTCSGPNESCVNATENAQCLGSGAGCPANVPTCGAGINQVCCPSGSCNSAGGCDPPLSFGITADVTETQTGPDISISGTGFTPGARVAVRYLGIPSGGNATHNSVPDTFAPVADSSGNWSLTDGGQEGHLVAQCCQGVFGANVTIIATDGDPKSVGTGKQTSTTVFTSYWCANEANCP